MESLAKRNMRWISRKTLSTGAMQDEDNSRKPHYRTSLPGQHRRLVWFVLRRLQSSSIPHNDLTEHNTRSRDLRINSPSQVGSEVLVLTHVRELECLPWVFLVYVERWKLGPTRNTAQRTANA